MKKIIEFKNFTFSYKNNANPTLKNINLDIYEGQKILIVGKSGCGKSTLAKCINKLIPRVYKGTITGEVKINSKNIGTILQDSDSQFVGMNVGEDIAFALENDCINKNEMTNKVKTISSFVDMSDFLLSKPQNLSGGQKQRVALAGVLIEDVDILLFDEPLANLDPKTGIDAIKLINDVHKRTNATTIIIEHRIEDVLFIDLDRIIVIDDGIIVADGDIDEIIAINILPKIGIREPLYITAMKYSGVNIEKRVMPSKLDNIDINLYKEKVTNWYKSIDIPKKEIKKEDILVFEDVSFSYTDKKVLKNINFTVKKSEIISIVGKNGAGKSTLAKIICGFEKDYTGKIFVDGYDISNFSIKERGDMIGYVMQNPNQMISQNLVNEEVSFSLKVKGEEEKVISEKVNSILKICGLYPYRNWPISSLSYGQKKRVTIASILVTNPKILILDEPTAAQDYVHYLEIMEFIKSINEKLGITIIMITHDMHLMLEYTSRAITLLDGCIISNDSCIKTLANNDIIERANLKIPSLYKLAKKLDIDEYSFVYNFINYERGLKI
ncbi:ABC transporter ATP-binding protein [Caviibacter abscessus]|uniref:ABC transporter ATP-binding protein n=1 Tax=Caviibacter abscessus TaxID=1766719 RepID=UPI00083970DC|nr:ABC transporter ATP-binding protein [Caviibacter abscessus]